MNLWLIPALPLLGFVINGVFGRRFPKAIVNAVAIGSVLFSFVWVVKTVTGLGAMEHAHIERYFTWIESGSFNVGFNLAVDRLTTVMLLIVTGVGLLIHIYSIGYMEHEDGYYRFFAYMNLFMFFMLMLVLAENYLLLFIGWEGVGLCSYLLIGYYFLENFASSAGNKAFIVNRIGDFGFALAMFLLVKHFGTLDFGAIFSKASAITGTSDVPFFAICMLLLLGATGKSAQIPLYVWLPDAMAGPTPVSALIHAATMVTAGVYLIARSSVLFLHAPGAMDWVAIIGLATAFFAATIGLAQTDIKKVFAYSTVSQLGYMFVGVGVGAFSAGIFHLMTHAFFKALLFLGAGSVIHALSGEQDLRQMGGLRKYTPITFITLMCAGVAIAGIPPFSGFFSKDEILAAAYGRSPVFYWVGVVTAAMTAFYVFRALFLTFFGKYRGHHHPHESPLVMTLPLVALAILSLGGGFFNVPRFLEPLFPEKGPAGNEFLVYISVAAGVIGILMAYVFYVAKPSLADTFTNGIQGLYKFVYHKYYVDEFYNASVIRPVMRGSKTVLWRGIDSGLIDGIVNGIGRRSRGIGSILRLLQSGSIRTYAAWVVFGSIIVIIAMGLTGGQR